MLKKKTIKTATKKVNTLKYYFHEGTQTSIVNFQTETDSSVKSNIYLNEILPAFTKLVENLIFIHSNEELKYSDDFKNDCISFLYETLKKFDASRGTKAFSYFNVVAKNWIIVKSRKYQKRTNRNMSIDEHSHLRKTIETGQCNIFDIDPLSNKETIHNETVKNIDIVLKKINSKLSCENDKVCMESIIKLFENIDNLESLNKRAIFVYVRDMTNLTPKQLSSSMSAIRKHYRDISKNQIF